MLAFRVATLCISKSFLRQFHKTVLSTDLTPDTRKLIIKTHGSITLSPIDAHDVSSHKKFKVISGSDELLKIMQKGDVVTIDGTSFKSDCRFTVPYRLDLDITSEKGSVVFGKLDCQNVNVKCENGDATFSDLKVDNLNCEAVNIESPSTLRGNLTLIARNSISGKMLITNKLRLLAARIQFGAVYSENATIEANDSLQCGSLHGFGSVVSNSGDIVLGALDGDFSIENDSGETKVSVTRTQKSSITAKTGSIQLKLVGETRPGVKIQAKEILVSQSLMLSQKGNVGSRESDGGMKYEVKASATESGEVNVSCPQGVVKISSEDWISSLNLSGFRMTES